MTRLNADARDTLDSYGYTPKQWARIHFTDGEWHGDACGCTDDRCIGHHHEASDECQCLPALVVEHKRDQLAERAAGPIWEAYQAARAAGDGEARQAALDAAEHWITTYKSAGMTSFSLDELVDGRRGISYTTMWNDTRWLLWSPEPSDRERERLLMPKAG